MAVDYFLKINGIPGESQDSQHKNEIQLDNWSFGATQMGTAEHGSGMGAGRVSAQDFHFIKRIDISTPKLVQYCSSGQEIDSAVLTARRAGATPVQFLQITFKNVIISSYNTLGTASSDIVPRDEISFNFVNVQMVYTIQGPSGQAIGNVPMQYDLKQQYQGA